MVLLDAGDVLEELRIYHQPVSPGSYLIVENTNVNSHPVEPGFGPGPTDAIETLTSENDTFFVDTDREKFHLTFNPGGTLKRRGGGAGNATARLGRGLVADGPR
jgi:cephalosporin hydroxylase